ncbi:MAG TPA: transcription repressor NadR [Candidatus Baltobacteraceae bacterium]|nr:transcription repressor NadR [Candidatus Baltobacteraceae bacterium]
MTRQLSKRSRAREKLQAATREGTRSRRRQIVAWLRARGGPVPGGEIAKHFRVSRQCLVQDVAILRASGEEILATPTGYRLPAESTRAHRAILACKHPPERTEEELQILLDHGVKILDVIVEHPIYGELRGSLMLESRADLQDFLAHVRASHAALLSSLTNGVHLHTVEASRPEMIARAKAQLRARGFLLK